MQDIDFFWRWNNIDHTEVRVGRVGWSVDRFIILTPAEFDQLKSILSITILVKFAFLVVEVEDVGG